VKDNRKNIGILLFILLIFIAIIGMYFEVKRVPDVDYNDRYDLESHQPYGLYVFYELLKNKLGKSNVTIDNSLSVEKLNSENNVLIIFSDNANIKNDLKFTNFLKEGNTMMVLGESLRIEASNFFVSSHNDTDTLDELIKFDRIGNKPLAVKNIKSENFKFFEKIPFLNFGPNSSVKIKNGDLYVDPTKEMEIYADSSDVADEENEEKNDQTEEEIAEIAEDSLIENSEEDHTESNVDENEQSKNYGYDDKIVLDTLLLYKDRIVCAKSKAYKGTIIAHACPKLLANVASNQDFYADHLNMLLAELKGKHVYITSNVFNEGSNILDVIMKNKALKYAYYLTLLTLLLFIIYGGKRIVAALPVKQRIKNTSLEYVDTLAKLYEKQNKNYKLVNVMEYNFYYNMFKKFQLKQNDPNYIEQLAKKSKINKELITSIINYFQLIREQNTCSDEQLRMINNYLIKFENHLKNAK
jgi:hypothetical protein